MSLLETMKATFLPPSEANPRKLPEDLADLYHGHAAKRLIELRRKAQDLRVLATLPSQELDGQIRRRTNVTNRRRGEYGRPPDQETLAALDAELIGLDANIAELQRIKNDRDEKANSVSSVVRACEDYAFEKLLTRAVLLHTVKLPALRKGENEVDALDRVRDEIQDTAADFAENEDIKVPHDVKEQRIRDHVAGLAAAGACDVSGVERRRDGGVKWAKDYAGPNDDKLKETLAYFVPDVLIAKMISELVSDERALTDEQYEARKKSLQAKLLELERDEEELLRLCETKGFAVTRRSKADVRAVLALAGSMPAMED